MAYSTIPHANIYERSHKRNRASRHSAYNSWENIFSPEDEYEYASDYDEYEYDNDYDEYSYDSDEGESSITAGKVLLGASLFALAVFGIAKTFSDE